MSSFIPSFHLKYTSEDKLADKWFKEAINHCYYNSNVSHMLEGKDVKEIEGYANGNFDMRPFKKIFKSNDKEFDDRGEVKDVSDIIYQPLPLLPPKINAAEAIITKIPVEITVKAQDAIAFKKKQEDINFLKNKGTYQSAVNELTDMMGLDKIDLGSTKNGAVNYNEAPYGLDLTEPDEEIIFSELVYSLAVEAAYEIICNELWNGKKAEDVRVLLTRDQMYYAASAAQALQSDMTGIPNFEYCYPESVLLPKSKYPDFRDISYWFKLESLTVLELFDKFGSEICDEETLGEIINGKGGYADSNGLGYQDSKIWGEFKVNLLYCEIKSIDWVGVKEVRPKSRFKTLVVGEGASSCKEKVWSQNTYCGWWLFNTTKFFGKKKLDYAYRTRGKEYLQGFTGIFYKSKEKSLVELSIPENKKAQIADLKLQHSLYESHPSGNYIDLAYIRAAYSGLKQESGDEGVKYTAQQLIDLALKNRMIGDTTDFEGQSKGQMLPTRPIPGGFNLSEIEGYLRVIADANYKIGMFTGINDQTTGASANPEGLVGMQKLMINSSINQIRYINVAIERQIQSIVSIWAEYIRQIIKKGGAAKEAIQNIISNRKFALMEELNSIPLHQMGVHVSLSQREEEIMKYEQELERLKQAGILNVVDDFMLSGIENPREKRGYLAARYKQFERRQDKIRSEQNAQQQVLIKQRGDNDLRKVQAESDADVRKINAQGDVSAKILSLANELGMTEKQLEAALKKDLQQDRGRDQLRKNIATMENKYNLERQQPGQS